MEQCRDSEAGSHGWGVFVIPEAVLPWLRSLEGRLSVEHRHSSANENYTTLQFTQLNLHPSK